MDIRYGMLALIGSLSCLGGFLAFCLYQADERKFGLLVGGSLTISLTSFLWSLVYLVFYMP